MHIPRLSKSEQINMALQHVMRLFIVLLFLTGTCINSAAESQVETIFTSTLPLAGWTPEGKSYRYVPQNLYEYINGAAEFFIAYGFIELTGAYCLSASEERNAVTVDIYDMGNTLNAFGVFQSRRDAQAPALNIGTASVGSDDYISLYKDKFYVEIQAAILIKKDNSAVKNLASIVARHLPGDSSLPEELSYLPQKGRIAGSERYVRGGILGHAFLDRGITCNYQIQGQKASAFVAFLPSCKDAENAVEQHRIFLNQSKKNCLPLEGFGKNGFVSEEPFHKKIVVTQQGPFVIGVYDLVTIETGKKLLLDILKNIKHSSPKQISP